MRIGTPLLTLLIGGFLTAGCRPSAATQVSSAPTEPSFAGQTVRVACPDATAQTLVDRYALGWAHRSGARVETITYTAGLDAPPPADVWLLRPADLPRQVERLAPLPGRFTDQANTKFSPNDVFPLYRNHLLLWDQRAVAVPLLGDMFVCFYRRDLYQDAAHQTAFQKRTGRPLQPPTSWEDFLEQADYFHQGWRKEGSLTPLPEEPEDLDRLFYSVAAPFARRGIPNDETLIGDRRADLFAFHFDLETAEPRISQPGFVHALGLLQRLQKHRPAGPPRKESWRAFAEGQAVLCLGPPHLLNSFGNMTNKVGVVTVPGSRVSFDYVEGTQRPAEQGLNVVPYRGSAGLLACVPAASKHTEAAFALLEALSGPELSRQIVTDPAWGGAPFRKSHLDDRWDGFRLESAQAEVFRGVLAQTLQAGTQNPVVELRLPDARLFREQLLAGVRAALIEDRPAAQSLTTVEKNWRQTIDRRGQAEHRRLYELSLGLRPSSKP